MQIQPPSSWKWRKVPSEDTEEEDITSKRKKEVDPNEKLTCPQCYKMFCSKKNVKRHVQYEHERKDRLHCTSCNKTYASKTALTYHMKKFHSDSSGMKCDGCDEIFLEFKKFKDHIKIHRKKSSKKADHRCDECHATFSDKSNLNRHMSDIHSTSNFNTEKITVKAFPFQCEQCKFITKRKHYFEIHKIKQHGLDDKEDSPPENDSWFFHIIFLELIIKSYLLEVIFSSFSLSGSMSYYNIIFYKIYI